MNDNFFVFSDIHGRYDLWEQVKEYLHGQPAIFLGDAADRGPDGYQVMKELLDSPNIIYLKVNHEDMFIETARSYFKEKQPTCELSDFEVFGNAYRLLIYLSFLSIEINLILDMLIFHLYLLIYYLFLFQSFLMEYLFLCYHIQL